MFRVSSSVRVELGLQLAYLREFWDNRKTPKLGV